MKTSSIILSLALLATSTSAAPQFGRGRGRQGQQGQQAQKGQGANNNNNAGKGAAAAAGAGAGAAAATANNATAAAANANNATANAATANNATADAAGNAGNAAAAGNGKGNANANVSAGKLSTTDITTNATEDNPDAQSSLTLNPQVIATGFMNNGQDVAEAGQVASLTSNNNFINFCLTQNVPITNGQQIKTGSCNPAPIGTIPAVGQMPSAKFSNPKNGDTIPANTAFTITMNVLNLVTGNFVNANENYFAAPQQLQGGQIVGHTHVVVEALSDLAQTTPTNPQEFAFFKGVNGAAVNGAVSADVTAGVPAGTYRLCSINSSSNHQPVIVPIAQHGSLDDCVYFTASNNGAGANAGATASNATAAAAGSANNATGNAAGAAAAGAGAAAATGKGNNKGNQGANNAGNAAAAGNTGAAAGNGKAAAATGNAGAAAGNGKAAAASGNAAAAKGQAAKGQKGRRTLLSRL